LGVALFLILVWGSAFTLVDVAVRHVSPEWLVAYRLLIGTAFMGVYIALKGLRLPRLSDPRWIWYAIMAATGATLPFILIAHGQKTIDSGLSAILVGTMPLITVVLAHFFTDERLTLWKAVGFILGFIGIVILFLPKEFSLELVSDWKAQALVLMAAVFYAATTIIASRVPETPSAVGGAMMLIIGAILSGGWAMASVGLPPLPNMTAIICIIILGLGSTGIATVVYLWVIDQAGPSVMARINYFVPVCSVLLGVGFLKEALDWRIFVSLGVILIGVMISRIGATSDP